MAKQAKSRTFPQNDEKIPEYPLHLRKSEDFPKVTKQVSQFVTFWIGVSARPRNRPLPWKIISSPKKRFVTSSFVTLQPKTGMALSSYGKTGKITGLSPKWRKNPRISASIAEIRGFCQSDKTGFSIRHFLNRCLMLTQATISSPEKSFPLLRNVLSLRHSSLFSRKQAWL